MPQVCSQCQRANPPDAAYCYHDGALLAGHSANGGPVNQGAQAFPTPFVLPSGLVCRNFDQLAMACMQNWADAIGLLKHGYLAAFLGGLGRADLARAAQEAARFPDQDRGLDQLLAKLPTQVLDPPKLKVEPSEISLGVLPMGTNRATELHLHNHGMRLLYGSVVSDSKWLTLGEAPGQGQKLFQFGDDALIPVHIRGQHLRAGVKPLEGTLVIDSNGGTATVRVRVQVPVKPFGEGVLAGATTPREVAQKAKAAPQVAAPLFETGAVARWFSDNGWQYPVQGPSASDVGAVQQFFEALGLVKAPKLEVTPPSLHLQGEVGQTLAVTIKVFSKERRPVYAYGTCDQPWLDVGRAKFEAKSPVALLPVQVRAPNRPGETLYANVRITGNGNQRFAVPISIAIEGNPFAFGESDEFTAVQPAEPVAVVDAVIAAASHEADDVIEAIAVEPEPIVVMAVPVPLPGAAMPAVPVSIGEAPLRAVPVNAEPMMAVPVSAVPISGAVAGAVTPVAVSAVASPSSVGAGPPPLPVAVTAVGAMPAPAIVTAAVPRARRTGKPVWMHLAPLGMLALVLLAVMFRDLVLKPESSDIDDKKRIDVKFDFGEGKGFTQTLSFGVSKRHSDKPGNATLLTFDELGRTNSTVLRIDGFDKVFGDGDTGRRWDSTPENIYWQNDPPKLHNHKKGMKASWFFNREQIVVTQTVELIPGEPVEIAAGEYKRLIDTCLVRYRIENLDRSPHRVGLRFLLDTRIGGNDEPLFLVPGLQTLVDRPRDWSGHVPDFVQALEKPNLKDPGTVALVNLRVAEELEPPTRLSLTQWPGKPAHRRYAVPVTQSFARDSAVVIYWEETELRPGASNARQMGFTYGLYSLQDARGKIGITVAGDFAPNRELTVVALVNDLQPNETLELTLPTGMNLIDGDRTQAVPPPADGRPSPVTWRIQSTREGLFDLEVRSSSGAANTKRVRIRASGLF